MHEVGVSIGGRRHVARTGDTIEVPAGTVHDWWNAGHDEAHVLVEVNPGVRFEEMIVTFWGLANTGRTNTKGMPGLLQLALSGREFSDTVTFTRRQWGKGGDLTASRHQLGARGDPWLAEPAQVCRPSGAPAQTNGDFAFLVPLRPVGEKAPS